MAAQMVKPRDVVGGVLVMAIGAGFLLLGTDLPTGTSRRMGAGYFPSMLSWLMVALGAAASKAHRPSSASPKAMAVPSGSSGP